MDKKIKVFLVEDEFVIREGIKNSVDWEKNGFIFCGEATDGELALPLIKKNNPEIVITDIRMPFMDGLELSRMIKKELPNTEIIILTGYGEFEYAKECIRIGVSEYMLKPINKEELLSKLNALSEVIHTRWNDEKIKQEYMQEMAAYYLEERKTLFQELVSGKKTTSELLLLADKLEIDLTAILYNIILFKIRQEDTESGDSPDIPLLEDSLRDLAEKQHIILFEHNIEGMVFLLKADTEKEMESLKHNFVTEVTNMMARYPGLRYFGGIGQAVYRLSELPRCFEEAVRVFAHRYIAKESMFLDSGMMVDEPPAEDDSEFDLAEIDTKQFNREKVQDFLRFGKKEESVFFVEDLFREFSKAAMGVTLFRQYISMDIYFMAVDYLKGLGIAKEEMQDIKIEKEHFENEDSAKQFVVKMLNETFLLRDGMKTSKYKDVIEKVVRYVESSYPDPELSLNSAAAVVNFSPNHLSAVFSQEYGQTFIKYLTDYRMGKAKEFLRKTTKKSSDICFEVGYKDPHYFSYLFKKTQGMTPTQYREGREEP